MSHRFAVRLADSLIAVALASTFLTEAAMAKSDELVSFQTPTRNIGCLFVLEGAAASLRCDLLQNDAPVPPRPKSCDLDWGNAFSMGTRGRPSRVCAGDTAAGSGPVVAYGKQWKRGGFVCTSATTGLTCTTLERHGWTLTRRTQRLF